MTEPRPQWNPNFPSKKSAAPAQQWYEQADGANRDIYQAPPQPKVDPSAVSIVGKDGYVIEGPYRVDGGVGPRGALSCDTRLASLVVLDEEGVPEHLEPKFSSGVSAYRNAVSMPPSASTVTVVARARDPAAMVNIYRYDPLSDATTRQARNTSRL